MKICLFLLLLFTLKNLLTFTTDGYTYFGVLDKFGIIGAIVLFWNVILPGVIVSIIARPFSLSAALINIPLSLFLATGYYCWMGYGGALRVCHGISNGAGLWNGFLGLDGSTKYEIVDNCRITPIGYYILNFLIAEQVFCVVASVAIISFLPVYRRS